MSCQLNSQSASDTPRNAEFDAYWYAGDAEISRYELSQARYGELRTGEAVLIFVTEDFRTDRQVKYEGGDRKNVVPILKMNATKKFSTGLYPYSIMSSVFTPIENNTQTIKVSASSQEWCGHTYAQLNTEKNKYKFTGHSYFDSEADQDINLPQVTLEDELWTSLRKSPSTLPLGEIDIIPSLIHLRLKHLPIKSYKATASLDQSDGIYSYVLNYSDMDRKLVINFEKAFPYRILSWEEHLGGLVTTAKRTHEQKLPYWSKNRESDSGLRNELGLRSAF